MRRMDSRFLQSFIAVVDCGSMADAARRLDLPPTTVAQQMRALEADVGCALLTRVGRSEEGRGGEGGRR